MVYHDPCELGRGCGIYDEPRNVLSGIGELKKAQKERELEKEKNRNLEDAQKDAQKRMEEKDEYILKLKNRGFISRLLNKDI